MTAPSAQTKPEPDDVRPSDSPQEQAYVALVEPYLRGDPHADGWHLIDNADADTVRHALEASIRRQRAHPTELAAAALAAAHDIDGKVVVLRAVGDTYLADFTRAAQQIMDAGAYTVFVLPGGLGIEALDLDEMRRAGWVPAPKGGESTAYTEVWDCEQPPEGATYVVHRQQWEDDYRTRRILEVVVVDPGGTDGG